MTRLLAIPLIFLIALATLALGQEPAVTDEFVQAPGYEPVDSLELEDELDSLLPPVDSVFRRGSDLGPLAKIALILEAREGPQERARYHLTASVVPGTDDVLVQLDRYNLGPLIHEETVEAYGAENVADAETFGVGPHVSWRLVTTPLRGNRAIIVAASRMELSAAAAGEDQCLLSSCLSTVTDLGEEGTLQMLEPIEDAAVNPALVTDDLLLSPAAVFALMAGQAGLVLEGNEAARELSADSVIVAQAQLDRNLGQEIAQDGLFRVGQLMDDSVEAHWYRLVEFSMGDSTELLEGRGVECRRGEPDGLLCP